MLSRSTAAKSPSAVRSCGLRRRQSLRLRAGEVCSIGWPQGWRSDSALPSTDGTVSTQVLHSPRAGTVTCQRSPPVIASASWEERTNTPCSCPPPRQTMCR
jgi:hypothetical protein